MPHRPRHTSQSRHAHHAAAYSKENGDFVLQAAQSANITDPKELANFMGQMQVESHGFTKMHENLNYSGERLLKVFPGRNGMDTIEKANAVAAGGPEKIAEARRATRSWRFRFICSKDGMTKKAETSWNRYASRARSGRSTNCLPVTAPICARSTSNWRKLRS